MPEETPESPDRTESMRDIARLAALQTQLGESDGKFAKRWLDTHATTWLRLRDGTYAAADWTPMLARVHRAIHSIEQFLETATLHGGLLALEHVRQAITAVRMAAKQTRDRMVVVLAPTGGGKSSIVPLLCLEFTEQVVVCEATETWRDSYLAACMGIAESLQLELAATSARVVEAAVLAELKARPRKLVIDEAHYLGAPTLNLVKAILNKTGTIVVLLAIPSLWTRLTMKARDEFAQLRARTCSRIQASAMGKDDLNLFLASRVLGWSEMTEESQAEARTEVKMAGEALGLWDTAAQIASLVNGSAGREIPTGKNFRQASADVRAIR
jgi:type II secretory pathway predicted ATPase ExeA